MKTHKTSLTLPEDLWVWLRAYSESQGRSVSGQIQFMLRELRSEVEKVRPVDRALVERIQSLVAGVEVDLNVPLPDSE